MTDFASKRSVIGTVNDKNLGWQNVISVRHRNGYSDGPYYGMYLRSPLTGDGDLTWRQQYNGSWGGEKTILDSSNYKTYIPWIIDTMYNGATYKTTQVSNNMNILSDPDSPAISSYSGNYMRLRGSNGNMILIQWGWCTTTFSATKVNLTFPTAFYTMPQVFVQAVSNETFGYYGAMGSTSYAPVRILAVSKTNVLASMDECFSVGERSSAFFWFAIG